jgi:hypothetical protein
VRRHRLPLILLPVLTVFFFFRWLRYRATLDGARKEGYAGTSQLVLHRLAIIAFPGLVLHLNILYMCGG